MNGFGQFIGELFIKPGESKALPINMASAMRNGIIFLAMSIKVTP